MRLTRNIAVGFVVWLLTAGCQAGALGQATEVRTLNFATEFTLHSDVLEEDRTFWVSLPTSYENPIFGPERYPVIYAVDGISVFFPLAGLVNFMSGWENVNYQIPEAIVVGIATPNRLRDLTPSGGDAFLEFLVRELFPTIEQKYRTLPYRVYVGHSLGGLTSTHTLLHNPGVFDSYLAIDPSLWWDSSRVVAESPAALNTFGTEKVQLYYVSVIDSAASAGMSAHVGSIHQFGEHLEDHAPDNLKWDLEVFPNTDHSSIPLLSWYNGLLFVFDGYDLSHYGMMRNPELIEPHFDALVNNIGLRMDPPQTIFHIVSHYLTAANRFPDAEKAFYVINMGLKYHPEASFLHEKLGAAYEMIDDRQKALDAYAEALRLNPINEELAEKIGQLRN